MTRDETIAFAESELKAAYERAEKIGYKRKTRYIEVLEMAIKVLKQEPTVIATGDGAYYNIKACEQQLVNKIVQKAYEDGKKDGYVQAKVGQESKTGKWILLDECANSGYYCSKCQKKLVKEGWSKTVKKIKYCPNCGAKMEVEQHG